MKQKVLCPLILGIFLLTGSCSKQKTIGSVNQGGLIMVSPGDSKVTRADEKTSTHLEWSPEEFAALTKKSFSRWNLNGRQEKDIRNKLDWYVHQLNNSENLPSIYSILDIHSNFDAHLNEILLDGQFASYMDEVRTKFPKSSRETWKDLDEIEFLKTKSVDRGQPQSRIEYLNENLDLSEDQRDEIEFIMDDYFHKILREVTPGAKNREANLRITQSLLRQEQVEIREVLTSKQWISFQVLPKYEEYYATAQEDLLKPSHIQERAVLIEKEKALSFEKTRSQTPEVEVKEIVTEPQPKKEVVSAPDIPQEIIVKVEPIVSATNGNHKELKISPKEKVHVEQTVSSPEIYEVETTEEKPKVATQIVEPTSDLVIEENAAIVDGLNYDEIVNQKRKEERVATPAPPIQIIERNKSSASNGLSEPIQKKSEIEESAEEALIWEYSKLKLNETQIIQMRNLRNEISVLRTEIMVENMYDHKMLMKKLADLKKEEKNRVKKLLSEQQWSEYQISFDSTKTKKALAPEPKKRTKKRKRVFSKKMGRNSW